MNIHASDGHNFGWGAWDPATAVGTAANALSADYLDATVWDAGANYIAIVRHNNGVCEASKVWTCVPLHRKPQNAPSVGEKRKN